MLDLNTNWISDTIKFLGQWWPIVKSNFQAIQTVFNNHISGIGERHNAESINYTGNMTGNNVKSALDNHIGAVEGSRHKAQDIEYSGIVAGNNTKAAIDNLKGEILNQYFVGVEHDPLVAGALIDEEGEDFGPEGTGTYLDGRLLKWERKQLSHWSDYVDHVGNNTNAHGINNKVNLTTYNTFVTDTNQKIDTINKINLFEFIIMKLVLGLALKIGCVGDSLTLGPGNSDAYPSVLDALLKRLFPANSGITVVNDGVSGNTCADIIARLPAILAANYNLVILSVGINDTSKYIAHPPYNTEDYKAELTTIIRTLKNNNIGVLVLTPFAATGGGINYALRATDLACRQVCVKENVQYIDLRNMYNNMLLKNATNPVGFTVDYVHPRDTNYKYLAAEVIKTMLFIPTVSNGDVLPGYMSPFVFTNVTTNRIDGGMTYIAALKVVSTDTTGYIKIPIFVTANNLTLEMLANKNSTSGTAIVVKVNGTGTTINLNNGSEQLNQWVNIPQTFTYGLNWIEVFAADCNGNAEIQAFRIKV